MNVSKNFCECPNDKQLILIFFFIYPEVTFNAWLIFISFFVSILSVFLKQSIYPRSSTGEGRGTRTFGLGGKNDLILRHVSLSVFPYRIVFSTMQRNQTFFVLERA